MSELIICATGHRPKYCPCQYDENHTWLVDLKARLDKWVKENKPTLALQGGAIGFDTWFAETILDNGIPLHSYLPFEGQGENWPTAAKKRYNKILERSEKVIYLSAKYSKDCFFVRDKAMVENSSLVLALLNPEVTEGGTHFTVKFAKSKGRKVINFWPGAESHSVATGERIAFT